MRLSVILPVYNAEYFVEKSVRSVLNQTFSDFELIIINDGSTDNSLDILRSFNDPRIKLIDQQNKGLARTLNIGLDLAKGTYIARMDADDISVVNRFEEQVRYLDDNPHVGLLGTAIEIIDENDRHLSYHAPYIGHDVLTRVMRTHGNPFKHPTVMFRKELAIKCNGFNELIGKYFEDYFLWNSISKISSVNNLPKVLLRYRLTSGSIMSSLKNLELDQFVLEVIQRGDFNSSDKVKMDLIFSEIKKNKAQVSRSPTKFYFVIYKRLIDIFYALFGDLVIKIVSKIKS